MRWAFFYHSLVSDWNHGNAHFLRGVVSELLLRGHEVRVLEPADGWSRTNLVRDYGLAAAEAYRTAYPQLRSTFYNPETLDLDHALDGVDAVLVHEWNDAELVARLGRHRARHRCYALLFHDTHHRCVTNPEEMRQHDLQHYDGALVFGDVIRELYMQQDWAPRAWTWHEAADARVFYPQRSARPSGDVVWIGNWGDDERSEELHEYLLEPVRRLRLDARVYGVRYPAEGLQALRIAGIHYGGWLPNFRVPEVFGAYRATMHIPRRPYREQLPGIPTIRVFEALACGIPLVTAFWEDAEHLFDPGRDYLVARDGREAAELLRMILNEPELAEELAERGRQAILARHTCGHRVDQLLAIVDELQVSSRGRIAEAVSS